MWETVVFCCVQRVEPPWLWGEIFADSLSVLLCAVPHLFLSSSSSISRPPTRPQHQQQALTPNTTSCHFCQYTPPTLSQCLAAANGAPTPPSTPLFHLYPFPISARIWVKQIFILRASVFVVAGGGLAVTGETFKRLSFSSLPSIFPYLSSCGVEPS